MIEYDDWVERLDLHARVKVEQMNARIGDLEADCRAANTQVECYRAEIERLRHSQAPAAPDDAVRAAAERLLARKMAPTGTNLPMDVETVARAVLAGRRDGVGRRCLDCNGTVDGKSYESERG